MGRKKIQISKIGDERNRQVRLLWRVLKVRSLPCVLFIYHNGAVHVNRNLFLATRALWVSKFCCRKIKNSKSQIALYHSFIVVLFIAYSLCQSVSYRRVTNRNRKCRTLVSAAVNVQKKGPEEAPLSYFSRFLQVCYQIEIL